MSILIINEHKINYLAESNEIGFAINCKSFEIKISEIKYIALSPRMALDDEECFLVFVDKNHKIFKASLFHTANIIEVETFFKLETINKFYFEKFSYNDHYGKVDKVIYPKALFWKDLYHKDWKLFIRGFYSWIKPISFFGNIIDYDK